MSEYVSEYVNFQFIELLTQLKLFFLLISGALAPPLKTQSINMKYYIHFLVTFDHTIRGKKEFELYLAGKCWSWTLLIMTGPFISRKKNCSDYRLHGTQNDRLILTVSTHKSVLKNMP